MSCGCPACARKPSPPGMPAMRAGGVSPLSMRAGARAGGDPVSDWFNNTWNYVQHGAEQVGAELGKQVCSWIPEAQRLGMAKNLTDNAALYNNPYFAFITVGIPNLILETVKSCDVSTGVKSFACHLYDSAQIGLALSTAVGAVAASTGVGLTVSAVCVQIDEICAVIIPIAYTICSGRPPNLQDLTAMATAIARGSAFVDNNNLGAAAAAFNQLGDKAIKIGGDAKEAAQKAIASAPNLLNPSPSLAGTAINQATTRTAQTITAAKAATIDLQNRLTTTRSTGLTTGAKTPALPTGGSTGAKTPALPTTTKSTSLFGPLAAGALGFAAGGPVGAAVGAGAAFALARAGGADAYDPSQRGNASSKLAAGQLTAQNQAYDPSQRGNASSKLAAGQLTAQLNFDPTLRGNATSKLKLAAGQRPILSPDFTHVARGGNLGELGGGGGSTTGGSTTGGSMGGLTTGGSMGGLTTGGGPSGGGSTTTTVNLGSTAQPAWVVPALVGGGVLAAALYLSKKKGG